MNRETVEGGPIDHVAQHLKMSTGVFIIENFITLVRPFTLGDALNRRQKTKITPCRFVKIGLITPPSALSMLQSVGFTH
jgi:hypothetical protein